mgnify:CR=1 FL=1
MNRYQPTWNSLHDRKLPEWYDQSKLGIFIHWGLYSVPAYAPKKDYAEWYGYACNMENPETEAQVKSIMKMIDNYIDDNLHHRQLSSDGELPAVF